MALEWLKPDVILGSIVYAVIGVVIFWLFFLIIDKITPYDLWLDEGYGYYLTTHPEDLSNEAVALFRSWLIARFSAGAPPRPPEPEAAPAEAPKLRAAK